MKLLYKILTIVCLSGILASCADLEIQKLNDKASFKAAAITAPAAISLTAADIDPDSKSTVTFEWTAAEFGVDVAVNYTLSAKIGSKEADLFAGLVGVTSHQVKASELYAKLSALGVGSSASVAFTVKATIGSDFDVITSEEKQISVTIKK